METNTITAVVAIHCLLAFLKLVLSAAQLALQLLVPPDIGSFRRHVLASHVALVACAEVQQTRQLELVLVALVHFEQQHVRALARRVVEGQSYGTTVMRPVRRTPMKCRL